MRAGGLPVGLSAKGRAVEAEASSLVEDIVWAACYTVVALAAGLGLQSKWPKGRCRRERGGWAANNEALRWTEEGVVWGESCRRMRVVGSCAVVLKPGKAPRLPAQNRGEQTMGSAQKRLSAR